MKWCILWLLLLRTASAQSTGAVISLEEFVVEATRLNPHPWSYLAIPGYEILSQCDEDQTQAVARHLANSLELERRLMPSDAWGDLAVPLTLILFDFKPARSIAPFVPKPLEDRKAYGDFGKLIIPRKNDYNFTIMTLGSPNDEKDGGVDAGDFDTHCVAQNRWHAPWNWSGGVSGRGPIPLGLLFRLDSANPPMPAWFKFGMVGPCRVLRMTKIPKIDSQEFPGRRLAPGATWLTDEITHSLVTKYRKQHEIPVLPSMGDLFQGDYKSRESSIAVWPSPERMAEAALFVRWGMTPVAEDDWMYTSNSDQPSPGEPRLLGTQRLDDEKRLRKTRSANDAHEKAFALFLHRSRTEPVTETVFKECFGFGYAEMQSALSEYLVTTAQKPFLLNAHALQGWSPDRPVMHSRPATTDEIGRIIGDWLRMQGDTFNTTDSVNRDAYLQAAGHVLETAFRDENDISKSIRLLAPKEAAHPLPEEAPPDHDATTESVTIRPEEIKDPRLLAVYGLYYHDLGDIASARVLLEAAVHEKAPRPAIYVALAELNRDAALTKPAAEQGRFSASQVAAILTPLFTVIKNWKLSTEGYLLIAETWSHSAAKPSTANLRVLADALQRYPLDPSLLRATAEVYAQWGYSREANEMVETSSRFSDASTARKLQPEHSTWLKQ